MREYYRKSPIPTHCGKGHQLTPENTYIWPRTGKWHCKTCQRERARRNWERTKLVTTEKRRQRLIESFAMLSDLDLAWIAGLFEGEGTVTIGTGGAERRYTRMVVSVTSTDTEVVDVFYRAWPTRRITSRIPRTSPNARRAWTWTIQGIQALAFLYQIQPFIRTNRVREKVALAIEAQESRKQGARGQPEEYRAQQESYRLRMKELNRRGRDPAD